MFAKMSSIILGVPDISFWLIVSAETSPYVARHVQIQRGGGG